ncbi:hypothetical protein ACFLQI_01915 [Candidatus Undinarchaeota archaeon]
MKYLLLLLPVILVAGCVSEDSELGQMFELMGLDLPDLSLGSLDFTQAVRVVDKQVSVEHKLTISGVIYTTKIDCKVRNAADEDKNAHVLAGIDMPGTHVNDMRTVIMSPGEEKWVMFSFQGVNGDDGRTYCDVENLG